MEGSVAEDLSFAIILFSFASSVTDIEDKLYIYRKDNENAITSRLNNALMVIGRLENIVYACNFLEKKGKIKGSAESAAMAKFILWNMSSLRKIKTGYAEEIEKSYQSALSSLHLIYSNLHILKKILLKLFFLAEKLLKGRSRFSLCKIFRNI